MDCYRNKNEQIIITCDCKDKLPHKQSLAKKLAHKRFFGIIHTCNGVSRQIKFKVSEINIIVTFG